jgi:hypothetical protein
MKIILGASLSTPPFSPGRAWHRLQYLLGLAELGHEVFFVEEIGDWCVDARGQPAEFGRSINQQLFRSTLERFGLLSRACLIYNQGEDTLGLSPHELAAVARDADLLINWSGHITSDFVLDAVKRRVFLDQDPVLLQVWQQEYGMVFNFRKHEAFVSTALNLGTPHTSIPDLGVTWHHVLPPVVLELWPWAENVATGRFTTVATLSPFGDVYYEGKRYGTKHDELKRLAALPRQARAEFEIAVKYYREEEPGLGFLKQYGWIVSDAARIADLDDYQRFIRRSRGEVGIVQSAQVTAHSGWFSDRWSHYLSSGKPVVAPSTGFEQWMPTGRGLFAFTNLDEAVDAIEAINGDYRAHCRAAREFAEAHLDHRVVLPALLEACTSS